VYRAWLVLAVSSWGIARGAAPSYSTDSIVNGANFQPGPFAPNSLITVFGKDLSFGTATAAMDGASDSLPDVLSNVRVYVANITAPLIYVGPTQINLLVPGNLVPGRVPLRVVRQGVTGPEAMITLADAAPQFFTWENGDVVAQHGRDYSLVTPDSPAAPGEAIVLYATGLGRTQPNPAPGEIPRYAGKITNPIQLFLAGSPVNPAYIWYAGLTPGTAGVYQINLRLPDSLSPASDVQMLIDGQISAPGTRLPTTADSVQPEDGEAR
jgi:uncharacterized protein (TIGR03437 family)